MGLWGVLLIGASPLVTTSFLARPARPDRALLGPLAACGPHEAAPQLNWGARRLRPSGNDPSRELKTDSLRLTPSSGLLRDGPSLASRPSPPGGKRRPRRRFAPARTNPAAFRP